MDDTSECVVLYAHRPLKGMPSYTPYEFHTCTFYSLKFPLEYGVLVLCLPFQIGLVLPKGMVFQ
jgi:hypothetical protein